MAKKAANREPIESINLELRFQNDGGPIFRFLSEHTNSHRRAERVRQLLYLGLLREKELTGTAMGTSTPVRSEDAEPVSTKSKGIEPYEAGKPHSSDDAADIKIHADDLGELFGAGE